MNNDLNHSLNGYFRGLLYLGKLKNEEDNNKNMFRNAFAFRKAPSYMLQSKKNPVTRQVKEHNFDFEYQSHSVTLLFSFQEIPLSE